MRRHLQDAADSMELQVQGTADGEVTTAGTAGRPGPKHYNHHPGAGKPSISGLNGDDFRSQYNLRNAVNLGDCFK